jgi:hypothetical protein
MAEMGALRMLMELKAFDQIPQEGSISYKELAAKVGAEESLLSTSTRTCCVAILPEWCTDDFHYQLASCGCLSRQACWFKLEKIMSLTPDFPKSMSMGTHKGLSSRSCRPSRFQDGLRPLADMMILISQVR